MVFHTYIHASVVRSLNENSGDGGYRGDSTVGIYGTHCRYIDSSQTNKTVSDVIAYHDVSVY